MYWRGVGLHTAVDIDGNLGGVTPDDRARLSLITRYSDRRRPRVDEWFARVKARPSYEAAVTKWLTEADRERFDISRDEVWAEIERVMNARKAA